MGKVRYPLVQAFMSRDGTVSATSKDPYVLNGVADKYNDKIYVVKRPGTTFTSLPAVGTPQGAFAYSGTIYTVVGDYLYLTGLSTNGTNGAAWTQATAPAWLNRLNAATCVFNNRMWIMGGTGNYSSSIWSTQDGFTWAVNAGGQPWGQRYGGQAVAFNNKMYFMGGYNSATGTYFSDVWSTSDGQTWTNLTAAAPWSGRTQFNALVANGGIYVAMGFGFGGALNNEVWFSSDGINWTLISGPGSTVPTPWDARYGGGMVTLNGMMFIYGGTGAALTYNDCWGSPDGIYWAQTSAGPWSSGKTQFAYCVYNNKMWSIAGRNAAGTYTSEVHSSTDGYTWSLVTNTPGFSGRAQASALVFRVPQAISTNRYFDMWLLGGTTASTVLNEVWYANLNSATQAYYNLAPSIPNQTYQMATFNNGAQIVIKNQSNMWVMTAGNLIPVKDPNYPPQTVPGIVVLNQFVYVMTPTKELHSCGVNDPTTWPTLQYTVAGYDDDNGVCIFKYLNYVGVFGANSMMYFFDNANAPPGISVSPYINANQRIGCAAAISVVNSANSIYWVGQTNNENVGVYTLDGVVPKRISTTWVDRVLQNTQPIIAGYVLSINGHNFYVVVTSNYCLVYDIEMGWWSVWEVADGTAFPQYYCVSDTTVFDSTPYLIHKGGQIQSASMSVYTDANPIGSNDPFPITIQTDKIDDGKMIRKYWGKLDFVADQATTTQTVTISTSDNDYQSFTTWGTVDQSSTRPSLNRGGSSRRRAFKVTELDSKYVRWEAIELTYTEGES